MRHDKRQRKKCKKQIGLVVGRSEQNLCYHVGETIRTEAELAKAVVDNPTASLGVHLGLSGTICVEVDDSENGSKSLRRFEEQFGTTTAEFSDKSPCGRFRRYFYKQPQGFKPSGPFEFSAGVTVFCGDCVVQAPQF